MIPRQQYLYIARLVLENRTGLSLATGHPDHGFDSVLVKDANGLPTLPGTAIAGVLRGAFRARNGKDKTNQLFGHQKGKESHPSCLHIGWGCLLDQNGRAVFGLQLNPADLRKDELLRPLLEADHQRQRVRINHRGVAADTGKFDRAVLPAGHRFAVELALESEHADDPHWNELLGLLAGDQIRLGGSTRAGFGRMDMVACHQRRFDLGNPDDAQAFKQLAASPGDSSSLQACQPDPLAPGEMAGGTLELHCDDFFRFGGQAGESGAIGQSGKPADLLPKFEPLIDWSGNKALSQLGVLLIPGSSVKGALAHRFAFHYNALTETFADKLEANQIDGWDKAADCPGTRALFGYVADKKPETGAVALAGCLFIDDARLPISESDLKGMIHVAIDQFTGGARHGMLFEEQLVATRQTLTIDLSLDNKRLEENCQRLASGESSQPSADTIRHALRRALEDLTQGMLPLGAASGRGHGFFSGELKPGSLKDTLLTTTEASA